MIKLLQFHTDHYTSHQHQTGEQWSRTIDNTLHLQSNMNVEYFQMLGAVGIVIVCGLMFDVVDNLFI